jgi:hypothetical protein
MACRLVLRRAARAGSRAFGTKTDPATCLGPRPDLAHSPLTFDAFHYNFDRGRATGQPVCGVIDDFLTGAECSKLIDLATARGYESTDETIQLGGRKGRQNNKNVINISGRCVIDSQKFADKLWARLAVSASMQPVKALLKQSNPGWTPVGLNSVFRFLRYGPGDFFRPHRDSHFVPEVNDARHGRVTSFQSLLLYLDAPGKGGESFFPLPGVGRAKIAPLPGRALVFDHGLMHGGASLEEGAKHLVRTDIIYECLPGTAPPAWATAKIRYMT